MTAAPPRFASLELAVAAHTAKAHELFGEFAFHENRKVPSNFQQIAPHKAPNAWSENELATAKEMRERGASGSVIARKICRSRNAVIGKLYRAMCPAVARSF